MNDKLLYICLTFSALYVNTHVNLFRNGDLNSTMIPLVLSFQGTFVVDGGAAVAQGTAAQMEVKTVLVQTSTPAEGRVRD